MAKVYFEKLSSLIKKLNITDEVSKKIEAKHFFSGAALYVNETICVSWSPVGLAFKLPEEDVDKLINAGYAVPLKYFQKGHVKKGYALFENPDNEDPCFWKEYFKTAANQV